MTLDRAAVRRHIEKALEEHAHGDSCEAPECCPAGDPVEFASRLDMAPPRPSPTVASAGGRGDSEPPEAREVARDG